MKLVFLTWRDLANPAAGGAEVMFDRILSELAGRGHDVTLLCGAPAAPRSYRVVTAGGTFSQYALIPLKGATAFRDADLVIDTENGFPYFSPLWRRRPILCAVHHVHTDQWNDRFPRPVAWACRNVELHLMPWVYRRTTFVAISQSTATDLASIGIDPNRIHIIEPGVDQPAQAPTKKSEEPLFLSLNRLVRHKRIERLIETWATICEDVPGQLVIAGDGPELERLRKLAATVPRTQLLGRVSDEQKHELLSSAWFLLSASHHEGWGICVLEAAVRGTPTLAVDATGIRDAIEDGVTGVLVHASDESLVEDLAKAWIDLATDTEWRNRLGQAAIRRSASYSWPSVVDRWMDVMHELVDLDDRGGGKVHGGQGNDRRDREGCRADEV
jgi:glycosyltransferase involved in cell wall biosynthesis